jgi:hypothetical protein
MVDHIIMLNVIAKRKFVPPHGIKQSGHDEIYNLDIYYRN